MVAPVVCISTDSFEESVGSSSPIIILSDTIMPAAIPSVVPAIIPPIIYDDITALSAEVSIIPSIALEAKATVVILPACVLDLVIHSSSESDPSEDPSLLEHAPILPFTSPFLSFDSSEPSRDYSSIDSSKRPSLPNSHEVAIARWRSKVALHPLSSGSSSSSLSTPVLPSALVEAAIASPNTIAPFTTIEAPASRQILPASPGLPRRPAILFFLGQEIPFSRPYRTQPHGVHKMLTVRKRVRPLPFLSSYRSTSRHPSEHSSPSPPPRRIIYPPPMTFRDSVAYRRWRATPLSTMYLLTTSDLSSEVFSSDSSTYTFEGSLSSSATRSPLGPLPHRKP
ncbi:hypothetical protein Tco_1211796 [Tanacetum coccineum]